MKLVLQYVQKEHSIEIIHYLILLSSLNNVKLYAVTKMLYQLKIQHAYLNAQQIESTKKIQYVLLNVLNILHMKA